MIQWLSSMYSSLNGTDVSPWDAQIFPKNLWNPNVKYRVHKSLPLIPVLSQMNPVHTPHPIYLTSVLILSSHLLVGLSSGHFLSGFLTRTLCAILFYMRAGCPARTCAGKANCWDEISNWQPWSHDREYLMMQSADYYIFISVKANRKKKVEICAIHSSFYPHYISYDPFQYYFPI
jgi:hypothetical protein